MAMEGWESIYPAVLVGTGGSEAAETVFLPLLFVFPRDFSVAPQLWGSCTTIVGQLHHSCEAIAPQLWGNGNLGDKNKKLICKNKSKAYKP